MKTKNVKAFEKLSKYSYYCGIIPIFLGLVVIFVDVVKQDMNHLMVGVFIFISGYAFVKISQKLRQVLESESKPS